MNEYATSMYQRIQVASATQTGSKVNACACVDMTGRAPDGEAADWERSFQAATEGTERNKALLTIAKEIAVNDLGVRGGL